MTLFRNFYRCARCGHEWTDEWPATCDDDCPRCGARHMSPYKSEDLEPSALDLLGMLEISVFQALVGVDANEVAYG